MMKPQFLFLMAALFLIRLPLFASWAMIPLATLVEENPVIVSGTIVEVKENPEVENPEGRYLMDTGYIKVDAVLKNTLKDKKVSIGDRLPLQFPSKKNKAMKSTDIVYRKGQSGIWILEYRHKAFHATYPGDLQSAEKEADCKSPSSSRKNQRGSSRGRQRNRPLPELRPPA